MPPACCASSPPRAGIDAKPAGGQGQRDGCEPGQVEGRGPPMISKRMDISRPLRGLVSMSADGVPRRPPWVN